ncbi:MAG: hypothetical protein JOY96_11995 [Verrucomicrobia bacterium]|nr:hypothetical protein [Verrucomicrobiota bacterium]MBV9674496.1 hypothetical protein [Verrucomicrobiota bacterium]
MLATNRRIVPTAIGMIGAMIALDDLLRQAIAPKREIGLGAIRPIDDQPPEIDLGRPLVLRGLLL